jgi:hypothetical protein
MLYVFHENRCSYIFVTSGIIFITVIFKICFTYFLQSFFKLQLNIKESTCKKTNLRIIAKKKYLSITVYYPIGAVLCLPILINSNTYIMYTKFPRYITVPLSYEI